jgi:hypothetical protein
MRQQRLEAASSSTAGYVTPQPSGGQDAGNSNMLPVFLLHAPMSAFQGRFRKHFGA